MWHKRATVNTSVAQISTFGDRLAQERSRLGLSQDGLASAAGMSKRAIGNYERNERSPDAEQLMALKAQGVDILYLLTGERLSESVALDPMRRAVLDNFDRCSPQRQVEAVQYMALLAAGMSSASPTPSASTPATTVTKARVSKSIGSVAVGSVVKRKKGD